MAKTSKLSKIFVVLLFVVVAAALTFAFVNVPIGTANAEDQLVLEGQTADYIVTADENLQKNYDVTTNTYTAPKGMDSVIVLKVTGPERGGGILKFKFDHGATPMAGGYGLDVYFSLNGDDSFEINDGDENLLHIAEIHASGYKLVKPDDMENLTYENDIITINQLAKDDVIKIKFHNTPFTSPTISGLKMNEQEYSVTAKIEGEAHGTVSIGDDVTSADKDSVSANIKEGHTATFTVQPDDDYYAFWQDSTGKVVGCENSFTTDMIFAETNYIVRFEKIGENGLKTYYQSKIGEDSETSSGWLKEDSGADLLYRAAISSTISKQKFTISIEFAFEGAGVLDFDYHFYNTDSSGYKPHPEVTVKVDGNAYERLPELEYTFIGYPDDTTQLEHAAIYVPGEGAHTIVLEFSLEWDYRSAPANNIAFFIKNPKLSLPAGHDFTLEYDDSLGNVTVTGAKKGEGNSWTGYDGFPITFEASTTEVVSSLDKKTQIPTRFINWTVGDSQPTDTTLNLMFQDGKLTYGDKELTANEVKALFQEETIKPTAFRQISKGTSDTQQITDGEEVKLNINEAAETQLRIITAGFGKENEAVTLKVNGANASLQTVNRNDTLGELGDLLTDEILSEFNQEVQELKWWVQPNLGKQLVLEVAYTCDGYFGESVLTMYLTYTVEEKDLGSFTNSLNNVFTSDSEDGAYITTSIPKGKGEGDELWSATNEWEGDNGSIVFENNLHNINNLEQYSPGITSGQDRDKVWYYSYVRIGISQNDGAKRKGVLMFDIRLDITGGNGDRKGAVVVERRDRAYSNAPDVFSGDDVDYTPFHGIGGRDGTFNSACITSVLEYTNDTHIWGQNNPYVTDLGDGWYRCAFPTVRECDYLSEDDSYTHDTLQYFISFGFSGDVSARYAIRNMTFRNGTDAEFKFNANEEQNNSNVTAKVGDSSISSGQTVAFGSRVELTATAIDGQKFYGWEIIDKGNKSTFYASTSVSGSEYKLSYTVLDPVTVVAWFGNGEAYEARVGGHFYATLDEAVKAAKELGTADIVIVKNEIHLASDLEIPAGISLILPFSDEGLYFGSAASNKYSTANRIAWADGDENDNKYLTFFIDNTATLTVKGNFFVGGVVNHVGQGYQGHTSGAYAEVINNGHIVILDKGVMDVYGRVRGTGDIDVQSGDLKQPFLILDFMGGTETLALFMDGVTPFKRYAMINIECKFTIHYGARLVGHATLYALNQFISLDQAFIGMSDDYGRDTMIMLKDGAYVTATYDPNKVVGGATSTNCTEKIGETTLHFYGGAWFSYMQFTAMGITVPTSGVSFAIPYNYNLQLDVNEKEEGTYETKTDFMIMPGAVVHVCEKAKLILHSNAWIYDGFIQGTVANKTYPTASDLEKGKYSKSGNLIVDGTLEIQKKFGLNNSTALPDQSNLQPAIFVGIVQTTGNTGKIVIDSQAILTFRPFDGTEGPSGGNYFAYNSTARVWDAANGRFADLEAGKTYTAVKDKEGNDVTFTLESIKYTDTKESETDEKTLTLNQQMHGSWMEVHDGHVLDWKYNADKDALTGDSAVISRQCSVMGCNHTEEKYLLKDASAFETQIYKGSAYSAEELRALFLKMFGLQEDGLLEGFEVKFQFKPLDGGLQNIEEQLKNVPSSAYQIAVTLTNGVWLEGGAYVSERTFTFDIDPYTLTGLTAEITVDEAQEGKLPSKEYTSRQLTYGDLTVKFKGQQLALSKDYTIKNGGNINVAEGGTVTIEGTGNFAGSFELKFDITAVDISGGKLSVQGTEFVYNGQAQTPRREQLIIQGVAGFDNSAITVEINASNNIDAGTASVTVTGTGNFTGTTQAAEYNIGKKNIEITLKAQTTEYTGEAQEPHSSEGDWSFEAGAICSRDGKQDELNIQIKLARGEAIGAADYDLTFSFENDNYNVTRKAGDSAKFTIEQKSIDGATVSIKEGKTYTFNGGDITPTDVEVEVTLEGWDKPITFTVSATENRNKGTAKFTVSGTGNYKGTSEQGEFEIKAAPVTIKVNDLSSALGDNLKTNYGYSVSAGQFYGEDETIFQNNIINKYACTADNTHISDEQHQYKITLDVAQAQAALPNYEITVTEGVYTVNDSVFKDVVFEAQNVPYDGQGHKLTATSTPEGAEIEYKYQAGEAPAGDAWQDIPEGGFVNAGKYSIRVTITLAEHESKYQETRLLTIEPKDISGATVTVDGKYTYTGSAITIEETNIKVTLADWSLQIDFDIDNAGYENNTDATTETKAVVKIKGTGNYTGEATGEFEIAKKSIAGGTLTVSGTYTYNGEAQTPDGEALSVTLEDFGKVTFRVKEEGGYDNNVNATTSSSKAKVTVEGTGNFEGELSALFEIGQAQVDKVEVQDADGYVYSGSDIEPQLVVKSGAIALRAGDYDIEYTNGDDGHKNAGTVTFKVVGKGNFKGEVSSNFTIKAKKITVRLLKQTTVYTGATPNVSSEQNVGWEVDEGAICGDDDLNIRLSAEGLTAAAKTYTVKPEFTNSNYEVEWDSETAVFEITPATITITVEDAYSTYGDVRATLNKRVDGICESDRSTLNIDDYVTLSCDVNERTGYGTYDITCTKKGADPANYTIQIANTGTYTVNKRDVTVNITDQNDTYNVTKNYRWNANAWEVDENTPLVNGDERTALGVQLARPALGNAGTYVITATYESDNYNVTFKGSWDGEDANNEKAGTYTIAKKRVTDNGEDVTFMISVGGDDWTHEDNLSVKYSGEAITLDAQVYVTESGDSSLGYTIDPEELAEIRIYTVTVAIDDINYEGSRTFTVEVLTAAGYSQALTDALDELEEIVGELTYDALTSSEEHFGIVKQVKAILDGLSEEDKQAGEEQLARYERLVETWQNAADLDDDVIETAKDIADSPIKWLFVMVAEVSALLAALYVVGKGGLR